jgi:uncharacterized protein with HEPN domain
MRDKSFTQADRIRHALESIGNILRFCEGLDRDGFEKDMVVYSACLYQYAIVAEAMSHVDRSVLARYDYPWHKVKSFRNFILHDYHSIDLRTVHDTTVNVLPGLKILLLEVLEKEFPDKPRIPIP